MVISKAKDILATVQYMLCLTLNRQSVCKSNFLISFSLFALNRGYTVRCWLPNRLSAANYSASKKPIKFNRFLHGYLSKCNFYTLPWRLLSASCNKLPMALCSTKVAYVRLNIYGKWVNYI